MKYAKRTDYLKPEGAYRVLAKSMEMEAHGREIIHFEIGQPDFNTFHYISQSGIEAIKAGKTRYTPPAGIAKLRQVIASQASQRLGVPILPEQVVVSPGAKPNLFFPTLAIVEPGDEVIYPDPGFPTYVAMIRLAGGVPVPVPLLEKNNFAFNLDVFDRLLTSRTRMVIINSPSNPTGGVMGWNDLEYLAKIAQERDLWVMSDEIYTRMVYDGQSAPSIYSLPGMQERSIIVDGFSKTYAMTGWRLGYGIMPIELALRGELILTHSIGCTADFTQHAGVEAILGPQESVEAMVREFEKRRNLIVEGLNTLPGFSCQKPNGAFYVFPNIQATGLSSNTLADLILEKAGVAVLPGTAFGNFGEGYLRLTYANSLEKIEKGIEKIKIMLREM